MSMCIYKHVLACNAIAYEVLSDGTKYFNLVAVVVLSHID